MAAIAAGNLIFARLATRLPAQRIYLLGVLTIASLNLLSMFAPSIATLMACRAPAGFALGAVAATVMTTAGRSDRPEHTFGIINSMVGVMGVFVAFVLPRALALKSVLPAPASYAPWSEIDGLYLVYAICAALAVLFIFKTPQTESVQLTPGAEKPRLLFGWIGLVGLGIIFFGHATLGLFIVKIGRSVSLSAEVIGYVFMIGSVAGIVLPLLSGYIGARMNALMPITLVVSAISLAALALAHATTPMQFFLAAPVYAMLPIAIMPIFLGCLSRLDPTGSLAGSHAAFVLIGSALAPFIGGMLSDAGGFPLTGWFAATAVIVGWLLIIRAVRRSDEIRMTTAAPALPATG